MIIGDLISRGPLNIRRRLFRDVFGVVLVTVCALVALGLFQGRSVKDGISEQLIAESSLLVQKRFSGYLEKFGTGLRLLARMGPTSLLESMRPEDLAQVMMPVMDTYEDIQSITVLETGGTGVTFTRSASGYVPETIIESTASAIRESMLYQAAMEAQEDAPVIWMSSGERISGEAGFSAAIRVDSPQDGRQLFVEFFITVGKIISFIADIETPENVDIIFYNREGMFLSRKQLRARNSVVAGSLSADHGSAPAETRKAISLWKKEGGDEKSVARFVQDGVTWWAGYTPLAQKDDETWICIVVPETDIVSDVKKQWLQLGLVAGGILLGAILLTVGLVRKYGSQFKDLPNRRSIHASLAENVRKFIDAGESANLEFKSSMRMNLQTGKSGKEIELAWLKGVVAFMNSDGGILLIGVADNGEILGIGSDGFDSEDKCRLHFRNLINTHIGAELARYIHLSICRVEDKEVLVIECERVREPVFLKIGKSEEFYVRSGPSSMKLTISQTVNYLSAR